MGLEVGLAHQLVDGHDAEHGGLPHTALNVVIRLGEMKKYPFSFQFIKLTFNNPGITSATCVSILSVVCFSTTFVNILMAA